LNQSAHPLIILDGSLGLELSKRGFDKRELWATHALLEDPSAVRQLHIDYIEAGADVITTNTYSCAPLYLAREPGLSGRARELTALAGRLAVEAREEAGRPDIRIAASLPPLDESYRPDLVRSADEMVVWYQMMVEELAPHVDLYLCETMSSIAEAEAAASVAAQTAKPVWVSWTILDDKPATLRSGETVADAVAAIAGHDPSALLFNCSTPEAITASMPILRAQTDLPIGAYANGFPPVPADFNLATTFLEHLTPEAQTYVEHTTRWLEAGASIVGGCCDIGPEHILAVSEAARS
jgi:S-methylmethionine-dependent homocysteine/selenocysteine methylase